MPVPIFLFVAAITLIWGCVMIALVAGFRRRRDDPEFRGRVQPLTLLDEIRIEV
jgi:hypothetical protein